MFAGLRYGIAGLALLSLAAGCNKKTAPPPVVPEVEVAQAANGEIKEYVSVVGEAKAYSDVDLIARVEGFLRKRNFVEGQTVKKGQVLFEIEPEQYQAELTAAEAALAKGKAGLINALSDYERQQKLVKQSAVSEKVYDNALARKMEAEAEVKAAEAQLANARLNLSYTKVVAPFDGWIGLATASEGDLVNRQSGTLAKVLKTDPMRIEFVINEMDILALQSDGTDKDNGKNLTIRLFLQNGKEYKGKGKLSFWNNEINPSTGTIKLQAVFENPQHKLIPGMFGRVHLEPEQATKGLLVPVIALMNDQAGDYVYVVAADGKVSRRMVKPGFDDGAFAVINAGQLKAGENVIVKGVQKVRPGATAKAVTTKDKRFIVPAVAGASAAGGVKK